MGVIYFIAQLLWHSLLLTDSGERFVFFREVLILPLILSSASATSISAVGQWRDEQRNRER